MSECDDWYCISYSCKYICFVNTFANWSTAMSHGRECSSVLICLVEDIYLLLSHYHQPFAYLINIIHHARLIPCHGRAA